MCALACSSKMYIQSVRYPGMEMAPHPPECAIRFLAETAAPDVSCAAIGDVFIGDTGFSTHCDIARVRGDVRRNACEMGGDTVTLRKVRDSISTCSQVRALVYHCAAAETP
jgi:hypothetical protein